MPLCAVSTESECFLNVALIVTVMWTDTRMPETLSIFALKNCENGLSLCVVASWLLPAVFRCPRSPPCAGGHIFHLAVYSRTRFTSATRIWIQSPFGDWKYFYFLKVMSSHAEDRRSTCNIESINSLPGSNHCLDSHKIIPLIQTKLSISQDY